MSNENDKSFQFKGLSYKLLVKIKSTKYKGINFKKKGYIN